MDGRGRPAVDEAGRAGLERPGRLGVRRGADRARRAPVARRGDQRRDRGAAGRVGRAGAALACRVRGRRGGGAAVAPAAGADSTEARGSARDRPRRPAGLRRRRGRRPGSRPRSRRAPAGRSSRVTWARRRERGLPLAPAAAHAQGPAVRGRRRALRRPAAAAGAASRGRRHPPAVRGRGRGADPPLPGPLPGRARRGRADRGAGRRSVLPGVLDRAAGEPVVVTSGTESSGDVADLLTRPDRDYAPRPGRAGLARPVVLVLGNGPIHTSRAGRKALAARPWLTVEWLPM